MKPSARIQAVIDLLEKTAASRVPMDATVGDYMRGRRYIGAKDRAAIVERVYAIVRAHARLRWHLAQHSAPVTARMQMLAWLCVGENMNAKQAENLFDGTKFSPAPLDDAERALLGALEGKILDDPAMPDAARAECPPEHEQALRVRFGAAFDEEMRAIMNPAPLDLRVNIRLKSRGEVLDSLKKDGVETDITPFSPWGLRARGKAFLSKTKAFVKGWVEIQDEGSQLVALLCGTKPGMQALDFCAGAGGKTLALAAAMNNKGRIVACDTEKGRLERARPRFRRAHVHDIIETRPLSDEKNRKWLRRQKGTFDAVLVDAPCSGSGTWRRNPDTRWRVFGPGLDDLLKTQAEILDRVAKTVKPGGRLVYATCSLFPQENEDQVTGFLARNPDFEILPLEQAWPEGSVSPCAGPYMTLTPLQHNTDGFFAAVLRRISA